MKSEFTFFTKKAIKAFLGNYGKEKSKDYEFAAALVMQYFYERRLGADCWIGIRIKPKYSKLLPAYNSQREITLEEVKEIFQKGNDEDSFVDFVIAKKVNLQRAEGVVFQVKRFGIGRNKKDTDELIKYLNSFKLTKQQIDLIICLDDGVDINMQNFYSKFNADNFPFNKLLFLWLDSKAVYLREVFPPGDTNKFPLTEIISL